MLYTDSTINKAWLITIRIYFMELGNNSRLLKTRSAGKIVRHIEKREKSISSFSFSIRYTIFLRVVYLRVFVGRVLRSLNNREKLVI